MTYLVSISSRGLVYIPKAVQKKMKIKGPGRLEIVEKSGEYFLRPARSLGEFDGWLKKYRKDKIWESYRGKMEKEYEEVY